MNRLILFLGLALLGSTAQANDYLRDQAEVENLLKGATLKGIYLRTQSDYSLEFGEDGKLRDGKDEDARWWVNELGQYCREWLSGPLAGNEGCMDLQREGSFIRLYFDGRQVAEGNLER